MGRPRKIVNNIEVEDDLDDAAEETSDKPELKLVKPTGIDVSKLVASVKGRYGKKEAGLSNELTTGDSIKLSDNDDDYILSPEIEKWWRPLTGIKGIPYGRITQISGRPDSGKSTSAMLAMVAAQKKGSLVIVWDSEKKFSSARYENQMGGDAGSLAITRSKNIIDGAKQVAWYVRAAKEQNPDIKILIVWDSVGSTLNSAEDDDENDDYSKQPGVTAKEVSWAIRKFNKLIERYKNIETGQETVAVLCINQSYANIGSVGFKEKGGSELEYLSSLILQLQRKNDLLKQRDGEKVKYGIVTRAKVKKNHLFDGADCISELNLVVSADGIKLDKEVKHDKAITGWDDED